jgi:hypothetical protein
MSSNTLIESILAENPERRSQTALEEVPLLVLILEHWRTREVDHSLRGKVLLDTGLMWHFTSIHGLDVAIGVCCVRGHCLLLYLWMDLFEMYEREKEEVANEIQRNAAYALCNTERGYRRCRPW